jgi:pyruvate/2-oxoglutarate dehydrogenase complex dihydrolipoamide acyltransferase (E2) component
MVLPKLNQAGDDAVVAAWIVEIGDAISVDVPVIEMETEKVTVEVCSTVAGRVTRQFVSKGDTVKVGQPILEVE